MLTEEQEMQVKLLGETDLPQPALGMVFGQLGIEGEEH